MELCLVRICLHYKLLEIFCVFRGLHFGGCNLLWMRLKRESRVFFGMFFVVY